MKRVINGYTDFDIGDELIVNGMAMAHVDITKEHDVRVICHDANERRTP